MGSVLSSYSPSVLVDIYLTATHRFATQDFYDASGNYYKGSLIKSPNMEQALSDLYYGVQPGSSLVLQFSNRDNQIDNTWDEIVAGEEIRGEWIKIQRHDPTDGTSFEFRGKITKYVLSDIVSITIEMRDDEILDTLLPLKVVTTDEFTTTALNLGEPVNICFGRCRNVPLRNIQNSTGSNYYDYLIGYGTIESLWMDHANGKGVKRDGVLVTTTEYTFYDGSQGSPFNGYAFIRFTTEQRNFSGGFHNFTADVYGLELGGASANRNFATCIKYLLNDATWGLNDNIDATSFSTAATALDNIGNMYCNGAITNQKQARDILHDLLFPARANIQRAVDGEWEITVDEAGASVANFGDNDGFYNNCEVLEATATPARIALKKAIVHYELDPYNKETPYKEMFASVHSGFGVEKTYDLPFVKGNLTAERILSYLKNRSIHSDERVKIQAGMEARDRSVGEIITLTAPRRSISAKEYKIDRIVKNFVPAPKFILDCREYSSSIYDNETLTKPTNPDSSDKTVTGPETWVGPITLGDGVNQSAQITLMPPANLGDVYIAAKNSGATFDWPNWEVNGGFILGLDDSDSDKTKFFIGDSGNYYFKWDGLAPLIKAANFELDASGNITVSNITATGGTIGGWTIAATTLSSANIVLDDGNDKITVNTLTIDGANDRIRSGNYVSGFAGAGFTLEPDLLEVGNIACRGIFRTVVFQKDVVSVIGGKLFVRPGDVLNTDMTAADNSTLTIEGNETFAVGDILRIKDVSDNEYFEVTNIASAPTYTVTRDKASAYGANANPVWKKGATVVNYGQDGDGGIILRGAGGNSPTIDIIDWGASPWTGTNTRLRFGNLNGFLGYISDLYGIAIGETEKYLKYDPTNGLKIKGLVEIIGAPALQNMLMNGGFEETDGTDAYYWETGGDTTTETIGGDNSNKYYKLTRSGTNIYNFHRNPDASVKYFEVNEGEVYEFGGSIKTDGTATGSIHLTIYDKDKANPVYAATPSWATATWTTKSNTYVVPSGKKFLTLYVQNINANGWAAFDNVYLKRVDEKAWSFTHASDRTKIDGGDIYANTITASQVAANTITASEIQVGSLTADRLTVKYGINLCLNHYTDFEHFTIGANVGTVNNGTATCDTGQYVFGTRCLKMIASAADSYVYLGASITDYNIPANPSTKYLISCYAKGAAGGEELQFFLKQDDGTHYSSTLFNITSSWARYAKVITTDAGLTDRMTLRLDNKDNGATVYFDALQVEVADVNATTPEPSTWTPGALAFSLHDFYLGLHKIIVGTLNRESGNFELQLAGVTHLTLAPDAVKIGNDGAVINFGGGVLNWADIGITSLLTNDGFLSGADANILEKPNLYLERSTDKTGANLDLGLGNLAIEPIGMLFGQVGGVSTNNLTGLVVKVQSWDVVNPNANNAQGNTLTGAIFVTAFKGKASDNPRHIFTTNTITTFEQNSCVLFNGLNVVGNEVDIHTDVDLDGGSVGAPTYNATAYWAQQAGSAKATAAFRATHVTAAWGYGLLMNSNFTQQGIYVKNNELNKPVMYLYGNSTSSAVLLLDVSNPAGTSFNVRADSSDPIYIRVGGTTRQVQSISLTNVGDENHTGIFLKVV